MTPPKNQATFRELLDQIQLDSGAIKIKPSFSWLPVIIQVVSLIGIMGWAYGALDGRLKLIEYRLAQIEHKVDGRAVATADRGSDLAVGP